MILSRLIKYQPENIFIFFILAILLWLSTIIDSRMPGIYVDHLSMPFYHWLSVSFGSLKLYFLNKFLALILVILSGILINGVLNQYNLLGNRTYLPGIIFVLVTANLPEYQMLHPILISTFFILLVWGQLIRSDFVENTLPPYFNAAFFLGISTLFYANYFYFFILLLFSMFMNRIAKIREFWMIAFGMITVWYFYFSLFFIFTNHIEISGIHFEIGFNWTALKELSIGQILFFVYFALLILAASFQAVNSLPNQKIQYRRNLKILFIWFILGNSIFFFTNSTFELIYLLAIPVSILLSEFFVNFKSKWIKELAFSLILIITLANQIISIIYN